MANVSIKFNNKEFLLSCEDGQEEHLEELLIQINQKFNDLKNNLGNLGENKLLLITAVKIMDEYYETKKKVDIKKDELKDLSNKFKELKSLIYEYRDKKEEEALKDLKVKTEKEDTPPVQKQEDKSDVSVPVMDDPNVIRSEIDDIRKSVVSMSVGQPDRTTTIVKEWLEQPAPAAPETTEAPAESGGDGGGEEAGEG